MCCLKNEQETYEYLNKKLPSNGDRVTTADGFKGEVSGVNVLRQMVKVVINLDNDEKEVREYPVDQIRFRPKRKKEKLNINDAELKELEAMEKKNSGSAL